MILHWHPLGSAVLVLSLLVRTVLAAEEREAAVPLLSGPLPEPPLQHAPWSPPNTKLPDSLISSVRTLFDTGLADPRGCEYREFECVVGSVWGGMGRLKTHGWILPHAREAKQIFAVSWAGTVYPAVGIGQQMDLRIDISTLLQADKRMRLQAPSKLASRRWLNAFWEGTSISSSNMMGIKVALLLRLGESQLAEQYWEAWRAPGITSEAPEDAKDPFRQLAFEWLWATFDRAVCAHMRGDDALALADCRQLQTSWPQLEAAIEQRGFAPDNYADSAAANLKRRHFDFLAHLSKLSSDTERRIKTGPPQRVVKGGIDKWPDKRARIQALVAELEEVNARQWGQPGGVSLNSDPTIQALVAEGDDAVESLLNCLEGDERLTRSVQFGRDFFPNRTLIPVKMAADVALSEILKVHPQTAAEYRSYWQKYRGISLPERWYRTLVDDNAGRYRWMEAAGHILSSTTGGISYSWNNAPWPDTTNHLAFDCEELRGKKDPSVSDLLLMRALLIAPTSYKSSQDCWTFQDAAELGLMLAEWDNAKAGPGISQIIRRCPALYSDRETWTSGCAVVVTRFAALAVALAKAGDTSGLDLYGKWLQGRKIKDLDGAIPNALLPLAQFPKHPSIKEAAAKIFQPGTGDWLYESHYIRLTGSDIILNESFRALVLLWLKDKSKAGDLVFTDARQVTYQNQKEGSSGSATTIPDALAPKPGVTVSFRVCDDVADRLKRIEGLPRLELYWPEAKRDEALLGVEAFLRSNGNDLKLKPAAWLNNR